MLNHHIAGHALAGTPERTQILLAATQTPLLSDPKWGVKLLPELCKVVLHLPSQARQVRAACLDVSASGHHHSFYCNPSLSFVRDPVLRTILMLSPCAVCST